MAPSPVPTFDPGLIGRLRGRSALLTPAEMGQADQAAARHGHPGPELMEAAGRAVARAIQRHISRCRVLVLAGPGNNGGDGYVAARLLAQDGWPVRLAALAPPREGSDAAGAARLWSGPMVAFSPEEVRRSDVGVDAVFGAGLTRPVDGLVADTLKAAKRLVAVDVPSGLDGATGLPLGYAPTAELTVTFFRLKPGHLLLPGRDLCGRIELADIGIPDRVLDGIAPQAFANLPTLWRLPPLTAEAHKYTRGHVTVVGGAAMTGAARLAAEAARRAGAGMVTIAARGSAETYRSGEPGLLVSEADIGTLLHDDRRKVWVCGPGLGPDEARTVFPALVSANRMVVGDADVFSAFTGEPEALRGAAVLTPHAGEFARVFGAPANDRLSAARDAAARHGCRRAAERAPTPSSPRQTAGRRSILPPRPGWRRRVRATCCPVSLPDFSRRGCRLGRPRRRALSCMAGRRRLPGLALWSKTCCQHLFVYSTQNSEATLFRHTSYAAPVVVPMRPA